VAEQRLHGCVSQGREGIKEKQRKVGMKSKRMGANRSQEWRARKRKMETQGDNRNSAAVKEPEAASKKSAATGAPFACVPSEHLSWMAAGEAGKSPPSPEQLRLRKRLRCRRTNLARADGPENTENSQDCHRLGLQG